MENKAQLIVKALTKCIAESSFFYFTLVITTLQGLWFAFSFRPILFDEGYHVDFIFLYKHHINPLITNQLPQWDALGDVTRNASYLFYYLMSLPLHVVDLFTNNHTAQIIFLRMISLAMFLITLVVLRKAFLKAGIGKVPTHLAIFMMVLVPAFAPLPGVVSYDIASFMLFAFALLWAIEVITAKKVLADRLTGILIIGGLMTVIKFTAAALALPVIVFVAVYTVNRYKSGTVHLFRKSFMGLGIAMRIALIAGLVVSIALVLERPVQNTFRYGLTVSCTEILPKNRCLKNFTAKTYQHYADIKPAGFQPMVPFVYLHTYWIPGMTKTLVQQWPYRGALPVMLLGMYILTTIGAGLILVYLRDLMRKPSYQLFLITAVFYTLVFFYQVYSSYVRSGQPSAISGRYLWPIFPLFLVLALVALQRLIRKRPIIISGVFLVGLLFATQGGGILSHLLSVDRPEYYWNNKTVIDTNLQAKRLISPLIKE
jgi:hypothetical protein